RILLFSALITLLSTAFQLNTEYRRDVGDIESRLHQVRGTFSDSLTSAVWTANPVDVELQLAGIMRVPDLQYVEVYDEQGKVAARAGSSQERNRVSDEF